MYCHLKIGASVGRYACKRKTDFSPPIKIHNIFSAQQFAWDLYGQCSARCLMLRPWTSDFLNPMKVLYPQSGAVQLRWNKIAQVRFRLSKKFEMLISCFTLLWGNTQFALQTFTDNIRVETQSAFTTFILIKRTGTRKLWSTNIFWWTVLLRKCFFRNIVTLFW